MRHHLDARPNPFPVIGELHPGNTALVVIDMQVDFCEEDGLMHAMGCDLEALRAPIEPIGRVLAAARATGLHVLHTREGYAADLSDAPPAKVARYRAGGRPAIGVPGARGRFLIRGEPCWDFIAELRPGPGEPIIDKPGYGAFFRTDLDSILRDRGVHQVVLCGVTTDCCVASTLRQCEDYGYDALLLGDCCASPRAEVHRQTVEYFAAPGPFGTVCDSTAFIEALRG